MELKALHQEARICAPPDFREWVEGFGIPFFAIGPEVRSTANASPGANPAPPTPEQIRAMMEGTVVTQFETIPNAAEGCDVIVAGNALQIAARSVAEIMGLRYVFVSYCPMTLPSAHHAPPAVMAWRPKDPNAANTALWAEDAERWTRTWGPALNAQRAARGLAAVTDVRDHILTGHPWLAADPALAPWIPSPDLDVFQPGAWTVRDHRPLSPEITAFLDAGDPPVYFGFGSIRAPRDISRVVIDAVRALGRRAIVSRGWTDLTLPDRASDCLLIGEVNQQALFERVAAVVHHGGAGTTHAAARAGAPQVVSPQHYDQPYFARRIDELGIGAAHAQGSPTADSLTAALTRALESDVRARAAGVAFRMSADGARVAARRLLDDAA
jgi:vancomycin aglycone glucosyltransferase